MNYQNCGISTFVTGDTYNYREVIKAHGGRWHADMKAWEVPSGKVAALEIAINAAPKATAKPTRPAARPTARPAFTTARGPYLGKSNGTCRTRGCGNQATVGGRCRSCDHDEM